MQVRDRSSQGFSVSAEKLLRGLFRAVAGPVIRRVPGNVPWYDWQLRTGLIDRNAYYDRLTGLILERLKEEAPVCVDVGSHKGSILRLMMSHAPGGTYLAFEPLPSLYEDLLRTFPPRPDLHIHNVALSDSSGRSSFNYVISNPGYSGLLKRHYDRATEQDMQIEVATDLLDRILAASGITRVSFMKIDVEGAEYEVLKGAEVCIARDRPLIIFEHGLGASDCYGTTPEDIFRLLCERCGLRISLLPDWLQGSSSLDRVAFRDEFYSGRNFFFIAHP